MNPEAKGPTSHNGQDRDARVAARRTDAATTLARVTEPPLPARRFKSVSDRHAGGRGRGRYLPSAQVLDELATLGPNLARLAADLRDRLTGPSEDRGEAASKSV